MSEINYDQISKQELRQDFLEQLVYYKIIKIMLI